MTCGGSTSWFGFAQAIFDKAGQIKKPALTPLATKDYPTPARRPRNSVLSNQKLKQRFGVTLKPWQDALETVMEAVEKP